MKYLSVFLLVIFFQSSALSCELTISFNEDSPYHFTDSEGEVIGSDSDLLKIALERMGCSYHFAKSPWTRTLRQIEHGQTNVAIGAGFKQTRSVWAFYSIPYKHINHHLISIDDNLSSIKSIKDFLRQGYSLAIVNGWAYPVEVFEQIIKPEYAAQIIRVSQYSQIPLMLKAGRVNGVVSTLSQLENHGVPIVSVNVLATYQENLHYLFSKKSVDPSIVARFNNELFNLIYSGERAKIFEKYLK